MSTKAFVRFLALLLTAAAVVCFGGCARGRPLRATPAAGRTVAEAGGIEIPYESLYYLTMNRIAELRAEGGEDVLSDAGVRAELTDFVQEHLLDRSVALRALGAAYGLDVEKGDIARNVEAVIESLITQQYEGDRDLYAEGLDSAYMTDHYLRVYLGTEDYLATEIVLKMLENGEIDSSDEAARARIESDDFARTVHVFLSRTNGYGDEENRRHAEEIQAAVTRAGTAEARYDAMREAIGGRYNNDYADTTGNGYYFARGEMKREYEDAVFALSPGEVSGVVETTDGYYVILRLEKDEAYIASHFQTLKEKSYFIQLNDRVEAQLAGMTLTMTDFGRSLDLCDLPVIEADGGEWLTVLWAALGAAAGVGAVVLLVVFLGRRRRGGKKKK